MPCSLDLVIGILGFVFIGSSLAETTLVNVQLRAEGRNMRTSADAFVDIRDLPALLEGADINPGELDSRFQPVETFLATEGNVDTLPRLGVQIVNTKSSTVDHLTLCRYLESAAETLDIAVICQENHFYQPEMNHDASDNLTISRHILPELGVNDPDASLQTKLRAMDMAKVWAELERPEVKDRSRLVSVAVVDHVFNTSSPEFANRMTSWEYEAHDNTTHEIHGWNAVDDSDVLYSAGWPHGHYAASIIAAEANNSHGIAGICQQCRLATIQVNRRQKGIRIADAVRGLEVALAFKVDIINIGVGFYDATKLFQKVMEALDKNNIIVISSAGENAMHVSSNRYPCAHDSRKSLCVGSLNPRPESSLEMAPWSNYGPLVDVAAPTNVLALDLNDNARPFLGTAASVAVVTGLAGMLLSIGVQPEDTVSLIKLHASRQPLDPGSRQISLNGGAVDMLETVKHGIVTSR